MDCDEILNVSSSSKCGTKKRKHVRIKEPQCATEVELDRPEMESDDEFEKEMNSVFEERVQQAELNGGIITSLYEKLQSKEKLLAEKSKEELIKLIQNRKEIRAKQVKISFQIIIREIYFKKLAIFNSVSVKLSFWQLLHRQT